MFPRAFLSEYFYCDPCFSLGSLEYFHLPKPHPNLAEIVAQSPSRNKECKIIEVKKRRKKDLIERSLKIDPDRLQMTPADGRAGNICVWVITCTFFVSILSGSCLLILYIALPASTGTSWFPISGMVLIGIPWAFWIFTCAYRCITAYLSPRRVDGSALRAAAVAPVTGLTADVESPVNSPGGARRVRFGSATLLGSQEGAGTRGGGQPGHEVDRGSPLAAGTTGSNSE